MKSKPQLSKYIDNLNRVYDGKFYIEEGELDGKMVARINSIFTHSKIIDSKADIHKLVDTVEAFTKEVKNISERKINENP